MPCLSTLIVGTARIGCDLRGRALSTVECRDAFEMLRQYDRRFSHVLTLLWSDSWDGRTGSYCDSRYLAGSQRGAWRCVPPVLRASEWPALLGLFRLDVFGLLGESCV